MSSPPNMVTVYRTMDQNAHDEAASVRDLLEAGGVPAVMIDDQASGVAQGTYEVRVHAENQAEAEALIDEAPDDSTLSADPSAEFDQETVFSAEGITAELEAIAIQGVLSSNGIESMVVGSSTLPNLRFELRVPHDKLAEAQRLIVEAQASGPAAAEEGERLSEQTTVSGAPERLER